MPTAPMAQRQVIDAPVPNIRVAATPSPDALGGSVGDTLANTGVRFYDLETRAANQTAVFEADRLLADKQTELEGRLYATKGKAVLGADGALQQEFDAHVEQAMTGLANDQQRGAFQRAALQRRQQLHETAQRHIRTEFSAYQDQETNATLASVADRIRQQPDKPKILEAEFTRATRAFTDYAVRKGLTTIVTPEMAADETFKKQYVDKQLAVPAVGDALSSDSYERGMAKLYSGLHKDVIDGLLAQDQDQRAAAHLNKYRSTMTAADLDAVEKSVAEGSTRGESRRQARELIAVHGIDTADQRRDVMAAVDKMANDKVADATRSRLEHEFAVYDKRKQEDYSRRFELGAKILDDQGLKRPNAVLEDLLPIPFLNAMEAKDRDALRLHLDRVRKPADHAHDPKVWFQFESLTNKQLANVKPETMMAQYLNHFDGSHYDRALTNWNAARNLQEKGDDGQKYVSALSHRERILNAWKASGIVDNSVPVSKWTAEQDTWYHRFETEADRALSNLPKDAKPDEIEKVLNGLSDKLLKQKYTVDPGMFRFNRQVPAIGMPDVTDARSVRIPLAEIPPARQEQLKGALKAAGMPVTPQNMEELEAKSRLRTK